MENYSNAYNESSFWGKLKDFAMAAGKDVIEKALILYYCVSDSDTPVWARTVIVAALGYFIFPIDGIPDPTPVVGFADDLGALLMAMATVGAHIKGEHSSKAASQMENLFGETESPSA